MDIRLGSDLECWMTWWTPRRTYKPNPCLVGFSLPHYHVNGLVHTENGPVLTCRLTGSSYRVSNLWTPHTPFVYILKFQLHGFTRVCAFRIPTNPTGLFFLTLRLFATVVWTFCFANFPNLRLGYRLSVKQWIFFSLIKVDNFFDWLRVCIK